MAYVFEVPRSIGVSDATISHLREQAQATGAGKGTTKVTAGLKSGEDVKIKSDSQITAALGAMFGGLNDPEHRRNFALMKRIRDLPNFMVTILRTTGYQMGAGLSEIVARAMYLLRLSLIIIPAQTVGGETIPFSVRLSRMVSHNDEDTCLEVQAHSITGRNRDFALRVGCKVYVFTCAGLFLATV